MFVLFSYCIFPFLDVYQRMCTHKKYIPMYREDCTYLKKIMSSICFFIGGIIQGAIVLVYM